MAGQFVEARLKSIRLVREGRTILRNVDWTIRPGERWLLAGGNGAGKTQLLKLISGAVWPTPTGAESRTYFWRDEIWTGPFEVQDEIAYVGPERQDKYERYEWNHSVERIVGTGLYRTDIPLDSLTDEDQRGIARLLGKLSIRHLAARDFLTLSYGERRLVLLARALATDPKLLLLDELLTGLDTANRANALHWLESTGHSELPWVLAAHRARDVPQSATHALVLESGRVVYQGAIGEAPLERWLDEDSPARRASDRPRSDSGQQTSRRARTVRGVVAADTLVRLTNASVYLDERRVLKDISLEINAGDCWVVHGPNGSGKSTLLRAVYGDHSIAVGGRIERADIVPGVPLEIFKRRVGFVAPHLQADHPQQLTVAEVVQSGRHASIGLNDPSTATERSAARAALSFFGLAKFETRTLRELSYGQLRRVLFARAWVHRPDLLLLDEPFAGVDSPTRRSLLEHVEKLLGRGVAVVMATHHREEWPHGATHELELRDGQAEYCGPMRSESDRVGAVDYRRTGSS